MADISKIQLPNGTVCNIKSYKLSTDAGAADRPVYFSGGVPVQCAAPESGSWWKGVPLIGTNGVMETGKYIDFHKSNDSTADYDLRLQYTGTATGKTVTLPGATGTVALLTKGATSYWGIIDGDGATSGWIRTTTNGFIPATEVSLANGGDGALGTSAWAFKNAYIANINGVAVGTSPKFTDANVTQIPVDSTYTNFRPLLIGNSSSTSAGFTPTLTTAGAYATAGIYCQPSAGYVYASDFMTNTYPSGTGSSLSQYGLYLKSYFKCADSNKTILQYAGYGVRTYSGKITSSDGIAMAVGCGGLTILGSGESAHNLISLISDDQKISGNTTLNVGGTLNTTFVGNSEVAIVSSDESIYFITNCQAIASRKPVCLDTNSYFYPGTNKTGSIGTQSYMWNSVYAATIYENGTSLANKYVPSHGNLNGTIGTNSPAADVKTFFMTSSVPTGTSSIGYNTAGNEYTLIFGKGVNPNGYGAVLRFGYGSLYPEVLRIENGTWKSTNWEKISAGYADSAATATNAATSNSLKITGYGDGNLTFYQANDDFGGTEGRKGNNADNYWSHYIIANHGDGETYYHYTIRLPFWGPPQYQRKTGGSSATANRTKWFDIITEENYASYPLPRNIKHIHTASGTEGTAGWVKIARITVTAAYANHPMTFTIAQRGVTQYRIHLLFVNNGSAAAAAISEFIIARDNSWADTSNPRAYIIKPSDGIFDLYIRKTENYDHIFVVDFTKADGSEGDNYSVAWTNVHAADSAITGGTEAVKKSYLPTTTNYAGSSSVGGAATSADALNLTHGNELNFSKLTSTGHVWFGYRWNTQGTETSGGTTITTYKFGNANGGLAGLEAATLQTNIASASAGVNANTANSSTAGGLSLYSTNPDNYGIIFRGTSQKGKHGYVTSDWATYFTMNDSGTRGWIFTRNASSPANVASISGAGNAVFNGSVTVGGNAANTSGCRLTYNSTTQSLDFVFA